MFNKIVVGLAASLVSFSALAVTKDITITASVDNTLEMTMADGTPLQSTMALQYFPGGGTTRAGLRANELKTRIWSNDVTYDMQIKLLNTPELLQLNSPAPKKAPLTVKYNGVAVTAAGTDVLADTAFPGGANGGAELALEVSQTTVESLPTGSYTGQVSIALVQTTQKP